MSESAQGAKVAVVTGGGSGIGLATARLLHERGLALVLCGRSVEALEQAAAQIGAEREGPRIVCVGADVGRYEDVERVIARARDEFGRLDVLINNAGLATLAGIGATTREAIERSFAVNAMGPAWAISLAWPMFERQREGRIVNVSTMGTADPFPGFFAYAGAKASVNLMALSCAKEGKAIGVRAFAVAPVAVETTMLRSLFSTRQVPEQACLTPQEVAGLIAACALGERDQDNGKTIFVQRGPGGFVNERVG